MKPVNFFAANQIVEKEKRKANLLKLCSEQAVSFHELAKLLNLHLSLIPKYCAELYQDGWVYKYRLKIDGSTRTFVRAIKFDEYPIPEYRFDYKPRSRAYPPIELPFNRTLSAMMGYTEIEPAEGRRPDERLLDQIYHETEHNRKIGHTKVNISGTTLSNIDLGG